MFLVVEMEVIPKPECYDSVPPCLCQKCQRYDMYMASCVPHTFGESTCGLAIVSAARSSFADVHSRSVRRKPARSRPRSVALPVTTSPVAVCSSTVSACSVVSNFAPFGCLACSSAVAPSNLAVSLVVSSPVAVPAVVSSSSFVGAPSSVPSSVVVSRPASSGSIARPVSSSVVGSRPVSSGSLACPVSVSPVRPSPVVVPPVHSSRVSRVPVATTPFWPRSVPRAQLVVPGSSVLPFGRSVGFPFVPVVCFVLAVVPVLLSLPFGFVWSFLHIWR